SSPVTESQPPTDSTAISVTVGKKRPRVVMTEGPSRERKRGKGIFGMMLGTLKEAQTEDQRRSAAAGAQRRKEKEITIQSRLRKDVDSSRRADEIRRNKTTANRKEEDIQLQDSIHKFRRRRMPSLANFLCTSDNIPSAKIDEDTEMDGATPLQKTDDRSSVAILNQHMPLRSHPPPLYYLPKILTPEQARFLDRRKAEMIRAVEGEWDEFAAQRFAAVSEIDKLRHTVAADEERADNTKNGDKTSAPDNEDADMDSAPKSMIADSMDVDPQSAKLSDATSTDVKGEDVAKSAISEPRPDSIKGQGETKPAVAVSAQMQADEDDAVEY
ncbi:hypothetical protein FISHEDRAFT_51698, partial [Fistulina hepatica ATCC 64428]